MRRGIGKLQERWRAFCSAQGYIIMIVVVFDSETKTKSKRASKERREADINECGVRGWTRVFERESVCVVARKRY